MYVLLKIRGWGDPRCVSQCDVL